MNLTSEQNQQSFIQLPLYIAKTYDIKHVNSYTTAVWFHLYKHLYTYVLQGKFSVYWDENVLSWDVPDPDSTIRYLVKCRHLALSGIRVKFTRYLLDSTVPYFITNIKWKT